MINRFKNHIKGLIAIPNKKELLINFIKDTTIITNFVSLAMMPLIVFAMGKSLKIEFPDTVYMKSFINLMTFMTHMSIFSLLFVNKEFRKNTLLPVLITDVIILLSLNSMTNYFGSENLVNVMGSALCIILLPMNFAIIITFIASHLVAKYRNKKNLKLETRSL